LLNIFKDILLIVMYYYLFNVMYYTELHSLSKAVFLMFDLKSYILLNWHGHHCQIKLVLWLEYKKVIL